MLQRRTWILGLGYAGMAGGALAIASAVHAQQPAQPIARPPGQRLGGALVRGRFGDDSIAAGALPGVYAVVSVDHDAETMLLRDDGGRTAMVHVKEHRYDLESLKPGDEVEVDFLVPPPGSTLLEAGGLWKVER